MKEIIVGSNPYTHGDNEHFPYHASCDNLRPERGRTSEQAILDLIQKNPNYFQISIFNGIAQKRTRVL